MTGPRESAAWHDTRPRRLGLAPAVATSLFLLFVFAMNVIDRDKAPGEGWRWGPLDYVVMGALLFGAGLAWQVATRRMASRAHRALVGSAIALGVVAIWAELAVGAVGTLLTSMGLAG